MDKNIELSKWFSSHPLFSINGMCKLIKLDTANFSRYLAKNKIPEKYIDGIEHILSFYGYKKVADYSNKIEDLKFAKYTDIIKADREVIIENKIPYAKTTPESYIDSRTYPLVEESCTNLTDYEVTEINQRIKILKSELSNLPQNFTTSKRIYIHVREKELLELQNKLK